MNETYTHGALLLGLAATRRLAHSARADAPVEPEDPRREARRRRRRERAGGERAGADRGRG